MRMPSRILRERLSNLARQRPPVESVFARRWCQQIEDLGRATVLPGAHAFAHILVAEGVSIGAFGVPTHETDESEDLAAGAVFHDLCRSVPDAVAGAGRSEDTQAARAAVVGWMRIRELGIEIRLGGLVPPMW